MSRSTDPTQIPQAVTDPTRIGDALPRERIDTFIAEVVPLVRRLRVVTEALVGNENVAAACSVDSGGEVMLACAEGLALVRALGGVPVSEWYGERPRQRDVEVVVEGVHFLAFEDEPKEGA